MFKAPTDPEISVNATYFQNNGEPKPKDKWTKKARPI
jgi:hypothetical protein